MASFKALPLPALQGGGGAEGSSSLGGRHDRPARQADSSSSGGSRGRHGSWWDLPHARSRRGGGEPGTSAPGAGSPTAVVELCNSEPAGRGGAGLWGLLGGRGRRDTHGRGLSSPVCRIEMPQLAPAWAPRIQMFLPSFRCIPHTLLCLPSPCLCQPWARWQVVGSLTAHTAEAVLLCCWGVALNAHTLISLGSPPRRLPLEPPTALQRRHSRPPWPAQVQPEADCIRAAVAACACDVPRHATRGAVGGSQPCCTLGGVALLLKECGLGGWTTV